MDDIFLFFQGHRCLVKNLSFLIFPRKQHLTFHANCLLGDNLHEMAKLFSGKNITNLLSAESARCVAKVTEVNFQSKAVQESLYSVTLDTCKNQLNLTVQMLMPDFITEFLFQKHSFIQV